jgi:hypothetical protein
MGWLKGCTGSKVVQSPRMMVDLKLLSKQEIENRHSSIAEKLLQQPYGPYDVLALLLGQQKVADIAKTYPFATRAGVEPVKKVPKRQRTENYDNDSLSDFD